MLGSTSNPSVDEQQAAATATAHREQEALVAAVAAARNTLPWLPHAIYM
jgi:hypothetical protein